MRIDPLFCFWSALCVLTLPLRWSAAAFVAAVIHELCHCLMIYLTGGSLRGVSIGLKGTIMEAEFTSRGAEALCALAGPLGSVSLLLLLTIYPELALCGAVQCGYNLLPIYPLDGGRILRCLFSESIYTAVRAGCIVLLAGTCLWAAIEWHACILAVLMFVLILQRSRC